MITVKNSAKSIWQWIMLSILFSILVSCNRGKIDNKTLTLGEGVERPLVASADISLSNDDRSFEFKCYKSDRYGEVNMKGDSVLYLRFRSYTKDGYYQDNLPKIIIVLENHKGFSEGDIYNIEEIEKNKTIKATLVSNPYAPGGGSYTSGNFSDMFIGKGELSIIEYDGKNIAGRFSFQLENVVSKNTAIIKNGAFNDEVIKM